jgi:tetratricopeptide (TPR) repeat protein
MSEFSSTARVNMDGDDGDESDTNSEVYQDAVDAEQLNVPETETVEVEVAIEEAAEREENSFYEKFDEVSLEGEGDDDIIEIPREETSNVEEDITEALKEKDQGNQFFREKLYDDSIESYSKAIMLCPKDTENKTNLATFFGNRSAAYFTLDEHELVIEDCTEALALKEDYVKVLARRMQSYEKLDKAEEALTDAKKIQELEPSYPKINNTIARLQPKLTAVFRFLH